MSFRIAGCISNEFVPIAEDKNEEKEGVDKRR